MSRYVLDANVPIKWFVPEDLTPQAVRLLEGDHRFIVPDLVYPEAGNALWQKLRRRQITKSEARAALDGIASFLGLAGDGYFDNTSCHWPHCRADAGCIIGWTLTGWTRQG